MRSSRHPYAVLRMSEPHTSAAIVTTSDYETADLFSRINIDGKKGVIYVRYSRVLFLQDEIVRMQNQMMKMQAEIARLRQPTIEEALQS